MVSLPVLTACSRRYSLRRESAKETGNKAVLNTCLRSAPPCPAPGLGFWSRSHILSCLEIAGVNRCGSPPAGDEKMQTHANLFGEHGNRWFQCSVWTRCQQELADRQRLLTGLAVVNPFDLPHFPSNAPVV